MSSVAVGMDVSSREIDVAVLVGRGGRGSYAERRFANTPAGHRACHRWLLARAGELGAEEIALGLEATGVYSEEPALFFHHKPHFRVSLLNPFHVKSFRDSEGRRAKTDKADARLIARFVAERNPYPWRPPALAVRQLRQLVAERRHLVAELQRVGNRLAQANRRPHFSPEARACQQRCLAFLREQKKLLEKQIEAFLAEHPQLLEPRDRIDGIPGLGQVGSNSLVVFFASLDPRHSPTAIAARAGLDPAPHQSGSSVRRPGTISRKGDATLRSALFRPTLAAIRHNPPIRCLYQRLLAKGKPKKLALVACMRKLLLLAWAIFKSGIPFDPHRAITAHLPLGGTPPLPAAPSLAEGAIHP